MILCKTHTARQKSVCTTTWIIISEERKEAPLDLSGTRNFEKSHRKIFLNLICYITVFKTIMHTYFLSFETKSENTNMSGSWIYFLKEYIFLVMSCTAPYLIQRFYYIIILYSIHNAIYRYMIKCALCL